MELFGAIIGMSIAWWAAALTIASLLFPLFWVWMLVDSILRDEADYPTGGPNEKLVWVLLVALVQFVAVAYYLMVYRTASVSRSRCASAQPQAPTTTNSAATV